MVELNEKSYLHSIERLLDKKLPLTKVPGPWKDINKTGNEPEGATPSFNPLTTLPVMTTVPKERLDLTVQLLKEKEERIATNAERMRVKKKASSREKRAYALTKKKTHKLSDFQYASLLTPTLTFNREGKYESVIQKIESNRIKKYGE